MTDQDHLYWQRNKQYLFVLLYIWFLVSYGFGILLAPALNQVHIGGFKLGFWFAQQGSIYSFVVLIFVYVLLMNRLDSDYESQSIRPPTWYFHWKSFWISLISCGILLLVLAKRIAAATVNGDFWPLILAVFGCQVIVFAVGFKTTKKLKSNPKS